jgi:hypothetical protein
MGRFLSRTSLSRRELFRLLGGAALALPALELTRRPARAQQKRAQFAVFIYTPDGCVPGDYFPQPGLTTGENFAWSPVLSPFKKHKDKVLVLGPEWEDGKLKAGTGLAYAKKPEQHRAAVTLAANLYKLPLRNQVGVVNRIDSPSIDQVIAKAIQGSSRFRSLDFGLHPIGGDTASDINFAEDGSPLKRMESADEAWDRVLGGIADAGTPAAVLAAQQGLRKQAALSSFLHGRFSALDKTVGKADRLTLERHLDSLRGLEQRKQALLEAAIDAQAAQCKVPERTHVPDDDDSVRTGADTELLCPFYMDVISTAFACGLTRVASLTFGYPGGGGTGGLRMPWLGFTDPLHSVSHNGGKAEKKQKQTKMLNWIAAQIAGLMDRLAAIAHGDGTLLDVTTLYWFNRHSDGNAHGNDQLPCMLLGGAGGYFKMGRVLALPNTNITQVLISIAHSLGVEIDEFGVGALKATSPLADLLG